MKERRGTLSAPLAVVNKEFNIIYAIFTFRNQECSLSLRYLRQTGVFDTTQKLKIKLKRSNKYVDYFDTCSQPTVDSTVVETYVEYTLCLTVCMHVIFRVFSIVRRY